MALGFGFNKAKVLGAAEKFVQQGKFNNAISEYEKVIKHDPSDLNVLNTVGDLHARLGRTEQAIQCFRRVGEAYASDGFTVKAIAMYKKVTKLSPTAFDCVLKLAELYNQQGLYNDARAQYVHLADHHLRCGDNAQASKVFQKMLELDPDNLAMQSKLAELYGKMGRSDEARDVFFHSAESHWKRGNLEKSDEALERALAIDPSHVASLAMRGKINVDLGCHDAAIRYLEKVPNLDSQPDALQALLRARLATKNVAEATPLAMKLMAAHNDVSGIAACADAMMSAGDFESALRLYNEYTERLLTANASGLLSALRAAIDHVRENASALEMLRKIYQKAGDTSHMNEVLELLAHALVQSGDLARARDLYYELAQAEPENRVHLQNYKQMLTRLGEDAASRPLSHEESAQAFMVDELEISGPVLEPSYPIEIADVIKSAITDSELLDSYNLPSKAIKPLESVLPKAPHDPVLNQRLASLYARAERFAEAARCCDTLSGEYKKAGHYDQAVRYQDMAAKYRERSGENTPAAAGHVASEPKPLPPAVSDKPQPLAKALPSASALEDSTTHSAEAQPQATEIDLSQEWDSLAAASSSEQSAEAGAKSTFLDADQALAGHLGIVGDLLEEIRFYLSQGMLAEAQAAIEKCTVLAPELPDVAELRAQLAAVAPNALHDLEVEVEVEDRPEEAAKDFPPLAFESSELYPHTSAQTATIPERQTAEPPAAPRHFPSSVQPHLEPDRAAAAIHQTTVAARSDDALNDLVLDLEESLGAGFQPAESFAPEAGASAAVPIGVASAVLAYPPATPVPARAGGLPEPQRPLAVAAAVAAPASNLLTELFEEFKDQVEQETANESSDPETHYGLGVAFREMGLLDEAIGELQKVCHAIEAGHPFDRVMEAYTWLAQCLVDKGVPQAALKWYERALRVPGVGTDACTAIHYEMAVAHESAGNTRAALDHFMEVYGTNIDYRDVSERIKSLQPVVKS